MPRKVEVYDLPWPILPVSRAGRATLMLFGHRFHAHGAHAGACFLWTPDAISHYIAAMRNQIQSIVERCQQYAWHHEVPANEFLGRAATMISAGEQKMLHWFAREIELGDDGCIVDAGAFLGGSTLALATGLNLNERVSRKDYRIHSYDMFLVPKQNYARDLIGANKAPGDTVLDIYASNLGGLNRHVVTHAGDIMETSAPKPYIDILLIDVAKTRQINSKIIVEFFAKLVPDRSIVVQQDHNDHCCPWVNASMAWLEDYFRCLCDEGGCRAYLNIKAIPQEELERCAALTLREEFEVIQEKVRSETNLFAQYFSAVSAAWTVLELSGRAAAVEYLENLTVAQPWESAESYTDMVKARIQQETSSTGLSQGYFDGVFALKS
jgi:hypothetical protein